MLTDEEARAKVAAHRWYHVFELRPGIVTPGRSGWPIDAQKLLSDRYGLQSDLSGLSALDIGALDGPYTFELERRGARTVALDIQDPDVCGFNLAKEVIGSRAEYVRGSVYDLPDLLGGETFDVITFLGVWYHLKHPVRAFEMIHSALKPDGLLLFEGEALVHYMEANGREPADLRDEAERLGASDAPVCLFYGDGYRGDCTNWSVPNRACLEQWLRAASFEAEFIDVWAPWPHQRLFGRARKIPGRAVPVDQAPVDG